jgi:hypothetical protein
VASLAEANEIRIVFSEPMVSLVQRDGSGRADRDEHGGGSVALAFRPARALRLQVSPSRPEGRHYTVWHYV